MRMNSLACCWPSKVCHWQIQRYGHCQICSMRQAIKARPVVDSPRIPYVTFFRTKPISAKSSTRNISDVQMVLVPMKHLLSGLMDNTKPSLDEELFEQCQEVRAKRRTHRQATPKYNPYLLRNLIYCHRCCSNPPDEKTFPQYGKMRPQVAREGQISLLSLPGKGAWLRL